MTIRTIFHCSAILALALWGQNLGAATITSSMLGAPFGVQPFVGLPVFSNMTSPFFSDLSGLPFPGPTIIDVLAGLQAFDASGNPISTFSVTGVTLTQGASTITPMLESFSLPSAMTYASTLNPLNEVTVSPGDYNLAFMFNSDTSFQYSYTLSVSGIPDGGFLLDNSLEGAKTPEPGAALLTGSGVIALIGWTRRRRRTRPPAWG